MNKDSEGAMTAEYIITEKLGQFFVMNSGGVICMTITKEKAEVIAQKLNQSNTWIKTSERMPEEKKEVLVYGPTPVGPSITIAWAVSGKWSNWSRYEFEDGELIAWQPLPEPPKE